MKRLNFYERVVWMFLLFNVVFQPINEDYLDYMIPKNIIGYTYWLSIGLFLGFQLFKNASKRYWEEQEKIND